MWNRACPLCFTRVARTLVLTRGEDLVCPSCRTPLELSRVSRVLGASCGLVAGVATVHFFLNSNLPGKWIFPVIAAVFAYGIGSAVALLFFSDVVIQPNPPA
jgi:LSD1 subclass zinc finger protein